MKSLFIFLRTAIFCGLTLLVFFACEDDLDPDNEEEGNDSTNTIQDFLVFRSSTKTTGTAPAAPTTASIKVNFKDSIFVIKDNPYMARVAIWHSADVNITGTFVEINNLATGYYYDVPEDELESNDTISVIYIGLQPPDGADVEYPYTIPITIKPHTETGLPLDDCSGGITVEDPEDPSKCSIMTEDNNAWQWRFTERYDYQGNLAEVTAPRFRSLKHNLSTFRGCCINNIYVPYGESTGVDGICNEDNPHFRTIAGVFTKYFVLYEYLFLFNSGKFIHYSGNSTINFNPSKSVCAYEFVYDIVGDEYTKTGTHDYSPGADKINLITQVATPPFGPNPPRGDIEFTCHTLIFTVGNEEKFKIYYQRYPEAVEPLPNDPLAHQWFD